MQAQADYLGTPRRELDVADYVDILRRHWMWIAGPAFAGLVISVVTAFLWPDTYVSYAVMRIVPVAGFRPHRAVQLQPAHAGPHADPAAGRHQPVEVDRHDQEVQSLSGRAGQAAARGHRRRHAPEDQGRACSRARRRSSSSSRHGRSARRSASRFNTTKSTTRRKWFRRWSIL